MKAWTPRIVFFLGFLLCFGAVGAPDDAGFFIPFIAGIVGFLMMVTTVRHLFED